LYTFDYSVSSNTAVCSYDGLGLATAEAAGQAYFLRSMCPVRGVQLVVIRVLQGTGINHNGSFSIQRKQKTKKNLNTMVVEQLFLPIFKVIITNIL
jgi:hypothetical protein